MRQIREVLRLRFASELPQRAIAKSLGLSQGTVSGYLSRARAAGVSWPLAEDLDDAQLEALLFPPPPAIAADQRPMPDWAWVHRELRRPNVTLALLWEEYRAGQRARRVRLFLVLRSLPGLGGPAAADDAPDPYRRREAVCRLRRPNRRGRRWPHR
jgi:transcriptional regulator with XRE-family HTH domain